MRMRQGITLSKLFWEKSGKTLENLSRESKL